MEKKNYRQSKVTPDTLEESRKLRAIWNSVAHPNQEQFGQQFDIGNQSAVGHFLLGRTPISLKAAKGFAQGLRCAIADFSPRLAAEASAIADVMPSESGFEKLTGAEVDPKDGGKVISVGSPIAFRPAFMQKIGVPGNAAATIDIVDRSNEPLIPMGAVVLLNQAETKVRDGKLYAFRLGEQLLVRKLHAQKDGSLLATAENPDQKSFPVTIVKKNHGFELLGRVAWIGHEI